MIPSFDVTEESKEISSVPLQSTGQDVKLQNETENNQSIVINEKVLVQSYHVGEESKEKSSVQLKSTGQDVKPQDESNLSLSDALDQKQTLVIGGSIIQYVRFDTLATTFTHLLTATAVDIRSHL